MASSARLYTALLVASLLVMAVAAAPKKDKKDNPNADNGNNGNGNGQNKTRVKDILIFGRCASVRPNSRLANHQRGGDSPARALFATPFTSLHHPHARAHNHGRPQ
jgi:hypothetical protein